VLAFAAVAVVAISLVTAAALVGTSQGLSEQESASRRDLAARAAAAASDGYRQVGGWDGADLGPATAIAIGGNARLIVRDVTGRALGSTGRGNGLHTPGQGASSGMGNGSGGGMGGGTGSGMSGVGGGAGAGTPVMAPVEVAGSVVGTVTLVFPTGGQPTGRPIAWTWVGVAGGTALALAVIAAWLITRTLTRPLARLTDTARAFAAGDRDARTGLHSPGELGDLAAAFDEAAAQVQASEQARRQMSADIAHELRTPLAALQAGLEELRDGLVPADATALARLHDQSLRVGRVVGDLAELSAADAARLTLRPELVDLAVLARRAAEDHEPRLRAAGLTLVRRLDRVAWVRGDPIRLDQVISNLLQNCARHCRPGDVVTLTVEALSDRRQAKLAVDDTGPGIPAADLQHVFTRFWRSGAGAGSGLGMPIVKSIVVAHHGTVSIDSDERSGTRVTVLLPASRPPKTTDHPSTLTRQPS
jgi:two-component system sensor histidine kinase BaeS